MNRPHEYMVVARRYRPQLFGELIGQEHVARALSNAITAHRVGHAYLFTGARGVGKTSAARILAKALDCIEGPTPTPCNQCDLCVSVSSGDDVDVLEIDGASNRGIDEIRQLRQNVGIRPSRARFKIYIIDEVHMLTKEAFNALLKTLEEPPEHVKFIFCTTEANKIPITILSRCQRFDFAGIRPNSIGERLTQIVAAEGVAAEPEALAILARRANGSMRDSQSLLEQILSLGQRQITASDVHALLGTAGETRLMELLEQLVRGDAAAALGELDQAAAEGVDLGQLLEQLLGVLRDCMVAAVGAPAESFLSTSSAGRSTIIESARQLGLETILAAMQILEHTLTRLRYSTQGRTLAELALVRICALENLSELPALLGHLLNSGGPPANVAGPRESSRSTSGSPASPDWAKKKADSALSSAAVRDDAAPAAEPADGDAAVDEVISAERSVPPRRLTPEDGPEIWRQALERLGADLVADHAAMAERLLLRPSAQGHVGRADGSDCSGAGTQPAGDAPPLAAAELTASEGKSAHANSAPHRLAVHFSAKYNSCKMFCERSDQLGKLERALADASGWPVRIEFVLDRDGPATAPAGRAEVQAFQPAGAARQPAAPAATAGSARPNLRQRIQEKSEHPLVRRAMELFGATPVHVEEPRSSS